jgi:thiol-disulfide isomerase/thioredoxin
MGKRTEFRLQRERQMQNTTIAVVIGLALILLSAVALVILPRTDIGITTTDANNLSTIPAEVNYPAPELALENIEGKTESLTDYRDKVILVNNWATWCPPCKAEMPTLVAFYNDHARDGLMIIAIEAGEPKEQVQEFAGQYQMPFAVWLDPDGASLNAFKNGNLPNSYVVDRSGTVRLMWVGEINRATLEKYVTPLLAEN